MNPWLLVGAGALLLLVGGEAAVILGTGPTAFIASLRSTLDAVAPYLSPAAQQIVIAHAAMESGWGASRPAQMGYNVFNVTRTPSDTRPVIESGDQECDADGNCKPITQRFAKYGSLGEAIDDYLNLLSGSRYSAALDRLEAGDYLGFAAKLREGGYFTLPLGTYQSRFAGVLASVQSRWA